MSTAAPTVCCSYASFFALGSSYAKRKDPPVSRRQVFLRSEHLRSAQDPIRLYRSNVINAVQYVLLYASRTGRQLCFAATQQKVSPAKTGGCVSLGWVFAVSGIVRDNATRAELSTGKIDRRNKHPNACDTCKNRWLYSNHLFLQIPIILSSHTYAMIFVQKENENAVINGVLAKDSSF